MYTVRQATRNDLKALVAYCKSVHDESRYAYIPVHEKTLTNSIERVLTNDFGAAWVAKSHGKIEGALIVIANQLWFSRKKEAVDLFFYVSPPARGSGAVLVRKYLTWARLTPGIARIMIGITSGSEGDRTARFYEKMGAVKVGGMYAIDIMGKDDEQRSQEHREGGQEGR